MWIVLEIVLVCWLVTHIAAVCRIDRPRIRESAHRVLERAAGTALVPLRIRPAVERLRATDRSWNDVNSSQAMPVVR